MTTYTIAYGDMLYACIPDGGDIAAALAHVEANAGIEIDRDDATIETGLILTDETQEGDEVVWSGHHLGWLTDEVGKSYDYAVRR